ncbi:class I SAM-dependent methyltransferase [Candidatus Aerophobetes bacterium]|nr:class I SAM-dependent methyltransferase [Candidatus Aerophobetes bacterium]
MKTNIRLWEKTYKWNKENKNYLVYPDEEVVRIVKKIFLPNGVKKVLDAGCGSGRHSLYMLRENLKVFAIDTSRTGLEITRALAKESGHKIDLKQASIIKIPYSNDFFDAVLCWGIIHYLNPDEVDKAISEFYRVIKPGGYLILTLRSTIDSEFKKDINKYDMSISDAPESKGMVFKYYNKDEIAPLLKGFKNLLYGHKTRTILGNLSRVIAHWFVVGEKNRVRSSNLTLRKY